MKNVVGRSPVVTRRLGEQPLRHRGAILWFTGLSGSGKSTLACAVRERLQGMGCRAFVLDGDHLRYGLCSDLGFSARDRSENIRRAGEAARLFLEAGVITLAAFISPFRPDRARVRALVSEDEFLEIHCRCPLAVCEKRDVKGLYKRVRAGEISDFTGISSPYEEPIDPELVLDTASLSLERCVASVMELLHDRDVVGSTQLEHECPRSGGRQESAR
ncbi:adenylyl-sulfate kinase [Nitrosovibrio sp. Nv17]|uniref:adenylyl-sulfate kinase n=1 Tax=Nitrosovibrio sp. Nv17 TaxID=1855339 RepID=UPI000908B1D4|nr:adenylyl-sulfate kinase [Nitrosovibrio sp. Nv17]SFW14396.1 adenylylsulfate kinase [Nitrosovibrio sp. Nv17]